MRNAIIIIALLIPLASCSLIESIKETSRQTAELAKKTGEVVASANETLVVAKGEFAKAKAAADTDGDGETSKAEWMTYLLGLLGLGGSGVLAARNARSNTRKTISEARIDALEKTTT